MSEPTDPLDPLALLDELDAARKRQAEEEPPPRVVEQLAPPSLTPPPPVLMPPPEQSLLPPPGPALAAPPAPPAPPAPEEAWLEPTDAASMSAPPRRDWASSGDGAFRRGRGVGSQGMRAPSTRIQSGRVMLPGGRAPGKATHWAPVVKLLVVVALALGGFWYYRIHTRSGPADAAETSAELEALIEQRRNEPVPAIARRHLLEKRPPPAPADWVELEISGGSGDFIWAGEGGGRRGKVLCEGEQLCKVPLGGAVRVEREGFMPLKLTRAQLKKRRGQTWTLEMKQKP